MFDRFDRRIHYLRVSVTDRCNLRCRYCMPPEGVPLIDHAAILGLEEIREVVRVGIGLGIDTVRLTGGEPLVRRDIVNLVAMLAGLDGLHDLAMTTNGQLLADHAGALCTAGLRRVNVSLDCVDPEAYAQITRGGSLERTLAGLEAARRCGLDPIKLNCVVERDANEADARAVAAFAAIAGYQVRFITRMDPARGRFGRVLGGRGGDCPRCNRLRLSSDGRLIPCLFDGCGYDIRELGIADAYAAAIAAKPARGRRSDHHMSTIGG